MLSNCTNLLFFYEVLPRGKGSSDSSSAHEHRGELFPPEIERSAGAVVSRCAVHLERRPNRTIGQRKTCAGVRLGPRREMFEGVDMPVQL